VDRATGQVPGCQLLAPRIDVGGPGGGLRHRQTLSQIRRTTERTRITRPQTESKNRKKSKKMRYTCDRPRVTTTPQHPERERGRERVILYQFHGIEVLPHRGARWRTSEHLCDTGHRVFTCHLSQLHYRYTTELN
jgi:hypothetical protein